MLHKLIQRCWPMIYALDKLAILTVFRSETKRQDFLSLSIKDWWVDKWSSRHARTHRDQEQLMMLVPVAQGDLIGLKCMLEFYIGGTPSWPWYNKEQPIIEALLAEATRVRDCQMADLLQRQFESFRLLPMKQDIPLLTALETCRLESALLLIDSGDEFPLRELNVRELERSIYANADQWVAGLARDEYLSQSEQEYLRRLLSVAEVPIIQPFLQLLRSAAARSPVSHIALAESLHSHLQREKDSKSSKRDSTAGASTLSQRLLPVSLKRHIGRR